MKRKEEGGQRDKGRKGGKRPEGWEEREKDGDRKEYS